MASEQARLTSEEMEDKNKSLQVEQPRVLAGSGSDVHLANPTITTNETTNETVTMTQAAPLPLSTNQTETLPPQSAATQHPGWIKLPDEELPQATYWPVIMALGITLLVFGFVTTPIISVVGILLFVVSLIGWIGDLRNESHGSH